MGTGGDVDTMGTRYLTILVLRLFRVGNGWRCRYDGNYTIFTKCNKLSIVVGNGWRCRYDGNPLMVMVPLLLVMMAVGNGWRCRYDGNIKVARENADEFKLGTGGDVDTMGTRHPLWQ